MCEALRRFWDENRGDPVFWVLAVLGTMALMAIAAFPGLIHIGWDSTTMHEHETCVQMVSGGWICK